MNYNYCINTITQPPKQASQANIPSYAMSFTLILYTKNETSKMLFCYYCNANVFTLKKHII